MSMEKAESGEINIVMTEEQKHAMTTRTGEECRVRGSGERSGVDKSDWSKDRGQLALVSDDVLSEGRSFP